MMQAHALLLICKAKNGMNSVQSARSVCLQVGYALTLLVSVQWIAIYLLILWDTCETA